MEYITIRDEFIKLGQALKLAGVVGSGVDAKLLIENEEVLVDGEIETRRGRKIYEGMVVSCQGTQFQVKSSGRD